MDWRIIAGLVGLGIVIGFVIRSSMGFLIKVAVVMLALTAFHVISPDGIPDMARRGITWVFDRISSKAKDALPTR